MTEEQKMQFMMTLAKSGANISQINLGDGTQNFYVGKDGNVTTKEEEAQVVVEEIIEDLLPFFYGDEEEVRKFVRRVKGAKAQEVTQQVNMLLRAKKISDKTCSKPLYDVLFKHGLYDKTYSNWSAYLIKN